MSSRAILKFIVLAAIACAPARENAGDSATALPAIDTVKPATDSLVAGRDSVAAATEAKSRQTATRSTKTSPASKTRDSIIGHDVAIPMDPKKPRLDTGKKPPPL